jgi:hypothetical protein
VLGTRSADKLSAQRLPISILSAIIQRSPTYAYTQHCASVLPLIGSCASQHHHSRTAGVPKSTSTLGVNTFDTDQTHATPDPSTNPPPLLHVSSTMASISKMKSATQRAGSRAPSVTPYQKLDATAQSRADYYIQEMLAYWDITNANIVILPEFLTDNFAHDPYNWDLDVPEELSMPAQEYPNALDQVPESAAGNGSCQD